MSKQPAENERVDPEATIMESSETTASGAQSSTGAAMSTDQEKRSTRITIDRSATIDGGDNPTEVGEEAVEPLSTMDPLRSIDPEMSELAATINTDVDVPGGQGVETQVSDATYIDQGTLAGEELTRIQEVCGSFESAWVQGDQEPEIADFVPECVDPAFRHSLVLQLLLLDIQYREKKNKILPPTEYLSRLPDCKKEVESAFARRKSSVPRGYGSVTVPAGSSRKNDDRLVHADDASTRYRATKFHAQGGLGAVFRAQDEELHRVVALKEILPKHSDNKRIREKFVFEAEVTGSLEHPGIVPVYGLGRYEDEQPYYAMRFIRGRSFRKVIEKFHQNHPNPTAGTYFSREFRLLLRRLIETCNAIHYAHEHGVLHRDIKPDNIMLGDYGETLVVDWGLAMVIGEKEEGEGVGTATTRVMVSGSGTKTSLGSAVGTPMYMSPEQAYGRHDQLDGRTDIYSLGAMLFNIATGDHPIEGRTVRDIVLNVRHGETRDLISVVPAAPRALASICRKAMELEPANRYTTAVELADDIDRWMSDEVVRAHIGHETVTERAGRLIRRHKSWTISGAAALLTITVVAVVAALLINSAKERERMAKEQTQVFKQDAVARYRDSRDAIDTWLVQSSDALEFFPGTQSVRERLLQLATEDYEKLSQRSSADPELELERGRALVKLGDLNQLQQDYDTARSRYAAALPLFETVVDDEELSLRFQSEHGNVHTQIGLAFAGQEKTAEAESEFKTAIVELTRLASTTDDPLPLRLLAVAQVNAGELYWRTGKIDVAIESLEAALKHYALSGSAKSPSSELGVARARELLGRIYREQGEHEKALVQFNESIEDLLRLVTAQPDHPDYLDALASAYISESESFRTRGLQQQALDALKSSLQHYRALRTAMPDVPRYDANLAATLTDIGLVLHESGSNKDAESYLIEARDLLNDLVDSYGTVPRYRELLAACQDALGQTLLDTREDASEALQQFANSSVSYDHLTKSVEFRPDYFQRLAIALSHYSQSLARQGKQDQAKVNFDESISMLKQLIEATGKTPKTSNALAHVHYRYGLMLHDQNDQQAQSHFESARDLWIAMDESRTAQYAHDLAWLLATCAAESVRDPEASRTYAQEAVDLAPENASFITTQALASLLLGDPDQSLALLDRSKSIRGNWIDRDFLVLAMAQQQQQQEQGNDAQQSLAEGLKWMEENRPYNADVRLLHQMAESMLASEAE